MFLGSLIMNPCGTEDSTTKAGVSTFNAPYGTLLFFFPVARSEGHEARAQLHQNDEPTVMLCYVFSH
jgi:hypothetical protein